VKEVAMLDYTQGWTWFLSGLGTTLAVVLVLLAARAVAIRTERRRRI
jgi:hypothetical protein